MNMKERIKADTPKFWKKVRKIGLTATAVGAVIASSTVALPAVIVAIGGYLATAGAITTALSQLAVHEEPKEEVEEEV
jgi:hypothetical protein